MWPSSPGFANIIIISHLKQEDQSNILSNTKPKSANTTTVNYKVISSGYEYKYCGYLILYRKLTFWTIQHGYTVHCHLTYISLFKLITHAAQYQYKSV